MDGLNPWWKSVMKYKQVIWLDGFTASQNQKPYRRLYILRSRDGSILSALLVLRLRATVLRFWYKTVVVK